MKIAGAASRSGFPVTSVGCRSALRVRRPNGAPAIYRDPPRDSPIVTERTVSLDEDAYERFAAEKCEGESFSDAVKRLTGERSWREVAGIWSDGTDDIESAIEEGRDRRTER
jgi:predicted CopG family antitoxin